jgi:hypothetical protein
LVRQRPASALDNEETSAITETEAQTPPEYEQPELSEPGDSVVTTKDELNGFYAVKAILRDLVDAHRVSFRDSQSYCAILLDDNNRKTICRLHFNRNQRYLGVFDSEKKEQRIAIDGVDDIFRHADQLRSTVRGYDRGS